MKKNKSLLWQFFNNLFNSTKNYYLYIFLGLLNLIIIILAFQLIGNDPQFFNYFIILISILFLIEIITFFLTSQLTLKYNLKKVKKEVKTKTSFYSWLSHHFWEKQLSKINFFFKKYKLAITIIPLLITVSFINKTFSLKPLSQTNFLILGIATLIFAGISAFQKIANQRWKSIIKKTTLIILILIVSYLLIFLIIKYLFWLLLVIFITWLIAFLINKLR